MAADAIPDRGALRRRLLFFSLYLSEGAPVGYIWLALPTRLRVADVPVEDIASLTALAVVPWTLKFAWAPLLDALRGPTWGLRRFILVAQAVMGLTLLATQWLALPADFDVLLVLLLVHAVAAATQDVGVDALCIATTSEHERGRLNGWMQAGMLLGRSMMGGGALILAGYVGHDRVVWLLVVLTTFSMVVLVRSGLDARAPSGGTSKRRRELVAAARAAAKDRRTWLGLGFALIGGASFKALEVLLGPFLVDRGYSEADVGWFSAGPMIVAMIVGSLVGGRLADRFRRIVVVSRALVALDGAVVLLAILDYTHRGGPGALLVALVVVALFIGVFTASSNALFMDLTRPALAATQFSAFMGAINGCEAWSTFAGGHLVAASGYPTAWLVLTVLSMGAFPLLMLMRRAAE